MITIADHQLCKRSHLMPIDQAVRFAKCIQSNKKFTSSPVSVRESHQTEAEKRWYVTWTPASIASRKEIVKDFEDSREKKAAEQSQSYQFTPCEQKPGWYYCVTPAGEFYLVHPSHGCDVEEGSGCADMLYRCQQIGSKCKHYHLLNAWLRTEGRTPVQFTDDYDHFAEEYARC